jgi:selenium metabolism protein YedF
MKTTILITADGLGRGDDELGHRLMGNFLRKLLTQPTRPDKLIFYNAGVKLLADGSTVLDAAQELQRAGVDLIACGTCISHFQLDGRMRAGRVSDMNEIVATLLAADRVVTV